jgi:hypothetical protein
MNPAPTKPDIFRDRVVELRRVKGRDLVPNAKNWRRHPQAQRDALNTMLREVGFAGAALARETDAGVVCIDGHLRAEIADDQELPVLILDVTAEEADKILATFDPLTEMAEEDRQKRLALLRELRELKGQSLEFQQLLASWDDEAEAADPEILDDGDEDEDGLDLLFKSPYPYFGGKARVAKIVWQRFGAVQGYVEPFFGSGAVFLNRPPPIEGTETINDADGMISNFWRSVQHDPDAVARYADWPVTENDLHARHAWLVACKDTLQGRLEGDPDWFDAKIAGWWVWGMSIWIGGRFCCGNGPWQVVETADGTRQLVRRNRETQEGINRNRETQEGINRTKPHLTGSGQGVNRVLVHLGPRGINSRTTQEGTETAGNPGRGECGLLAWMQALSERLRRVRICCGDWTRVCGGKDGDHYAHFFSAGEPCGVFLDPPYADSAEREEKIYTQDSLTVAHDVREWAICHGDDPRLRIALCGYQDEHQMPNSWRMVKWKAAGGMAGIARGATKAKANKFRERIWFSPSCLNGGP